MSDFRLAFIGLSTYGSRLSTLGNYSNSFYLEIINNKFRPACDRAVKCVCSMLSKTSDQNIVLADLCLSPFVVSLVSASLFEFLPPPPQKKHPDSYPSSHKQRRIFRIICVLIDVDLSCCRRHRFIIVLIFITIADEERPALNIDL